MCRLWNMSGFWIFQDCQFARLLNSRVTQDLSIFVNMARSWICVRMQLIWRSSSKFTRFLRMQALHKVLNLPEHGWIMSEETVLIMAGYMPCQVKFSQDFEYASRSEYARVRKMTRWICEGTNMSAEYTWINLNMPINNACICVNMP